MKKKTSFCYTFIFFILTCNSSCAQSKEESKNTERIYFKITSPNGIVVPLKLTDSITIQSVLDTGCGRLSFCIDSTFAATHPIITPGVKPDRIARSGSAWASHITRAYVYKTTPTVKMGKNNLKYDQISIENLKIFYGDTGINCMFSIPPNDTTRIWELNFQHNYIETHLSRNFVMPSDCYTVPIVKRINSSDPFHIKLPIRVKCASGDTVTIDQTFLIDTGMGWDIVLLHKAKELDFFNKQKDAVWTGYLNSYIRQYNVKATIFNNMKVDSLRIYTLDYPNLIRDNYLIGLNFLKRFNVFFDLKNQRIGLQPIKNFQRLINPKAIRYHLAFDYTPQKTLVIRHIADYKENYFKNAGLQKGDEIVAINGKPYKMITRKEEDKMYMQDSIVYSINRKGKKLKITVHIDKKEVQGD